MSELSAIVEALRPARRVLFVTGAGLSADSGLPTYRGLGGLYEDADTPEGLSIEQVLSGPMLRRDPGLCWRYIGQVEAACRGATPNAGHRAIAALEAVFDRVIVLTQNVDGFHRAAGSSDVIDIHGDLHRLHCTACDWRTRVRDYAELDLPPDCPDCGALVRPDVVLFGEMLPDEAVQRLQRTLALGVDAVVSVGTTSVFPYIAQPVVLARRSGRPTVEINPGETRVSRLVEHRVRERAAPTLEALARALGA